MQNKFKFVNFCILKRKPCMNLNLFCIFDRRKEFFTQTSISKVVQHKILCRFMLFFHDFSAKNSKKFDYYNNNMYTNSYFQMHLSRWGKRFRRCRKNKKCSIFHDLSEYISFFHMILFEWLG